MKRHYGLDLLRIFAMALIVLRHGVYQSEVTKIAEGTLKFNYLCGVAVNAFTAIAANCFVIITGFFLSSHEFRPRRLLSLWLTVVMYSMGVTASWAILAYAAPESLGTELTQGPTTLDCLRSCFPVVSYTYWFISLYFVIVLASPLLNAAIKSVTLRDGAFAMAVLLVVLCILPSLGMDFIGVAKGYSLYWFIMLYLTGAFLQRLSARPTPWKNVLGYLSMLMLTFVYLAAKKFLKNRGIDLTAPDDYNFILTFAASIFAFRCFQGLEIKNPRFQHAITFLTPLMLGVYLFHDHFLKHAIWHSWLGIEAFRNCKSWIYQVPLRIACLFAIACAVECLRRAICQKILK